MSSSDKSMHKVSAKPGKLSSSCGNGELVRGKFLRGDIIFYGNGVCLHYAVVVNDDEAIGYDGESVVVESIREGSSLDRRPPRDSAHDVASRAESRLGEAKYNLLFNNCETFADWCYTGEAGSSGQAATATTIAGTISFAGSAICTGLALETVSVGGFWGLLGYTTTTIAVGPLALAASVGGVASFGIYNLLNETFQK
eukprot:TRINITY_DN57566_c0_g1_i1.p1 TRINITY_DN57566_c0_g1~~TRINITY_DN57566_c0_g1_i1.p1  ORF type:complete len:198 (-),score=34.53 TRINITY_DN57566_c0_g1_i1:65-658(-)